MAAQIVVLEESQLGDVCRIKWAWTSATGGTVVQATAAGYYGEVLRLFTDPGTAAPTDDYDITITDPDGYDVMQGAGANRDTANNESVPPTARSIAYGQLTLNIANAGDAKSGVAILHILGKKIGA